MRWYLKMELSRKVLQRWASRWHRCAGLWIPLGTETRPRCSHCLVPLPPSFPPPSSLTLCLSRLNGYTYLSSTSISSLSISLRDTERYYSAKHGISAPRRTALRRCAPLRLSADRLGLDGTAGTRVLWQRGFNPSRRGGPYVWHGRPRRRLPAGLTKGRWRGSRRRGELTPLQESAVPGKTNVPAQQLVRAQRGCDPQPGDGPLDRREQQRE